MQIKMSFAYWNSMSALAYTKELKYHDKTNHTNIKYYYMWYVNLHKKKGDPKHKSTTRMTTEPLTKPLTMDAFQNHVKSPRLYRICLCLYLLFGIYH